MNEGWVSEDEDKGWVGRVACVRRWGRVLRVGSRHHRQYPFLARLGLSLAQSLFRVVSLSLLFSWGEIDLKVKDKRKWFYRVRGHILRSTEMIFRLTQFSLRTQTLAFTKKHSGSDLKPKQTQLKFI